MSSSNLSRRAILAGASAVPIISLAPAAYASRAIEDSKLDDLWRAHRPSKNGTESVPFFDDLWREHTDLVTELRAVTKKSAAANAAMPEWARPGHQYLHSDGRYDGPSVGWPRIEGGRAPEGHAFMNRRPSLADIRENFERFVLTWGRGTRKVAQKAYDRDVAAFKERRTRQMVERQKVGLPQLDKRSEQICDRLLEIREQIEAAPVSSMRAAALFMVGLSLIDDGSLHDGDGETAMADGILPLIRPQLSGLIAQHVDDLIERPERLHSERDFTEGPLAGDGALS